MGNWGEIILLIEVMTHPIYNWWLGAHLVWYMVTKIGSFLKEQKSWGGFPSPDHQEENPERFQQQSPPYAPIPSASGIGVGFRYLNNFQQGIWRTRIQKNILDTMIHFMKMISHH